jgi:argininosuccinate lyase
MAEDILNLKEEEFKNMSEKDKWELIQFVKKIVEDLKIRADKNCEECEKTYLTAEDINIDLFFQDWRECAERCDECGEEEKRNMCQLQFELINHIANSLLDVQRKQNLLTQLVIKRDEAGSKILNEFLKKVDETKKKDKQANDMYR